MIACPSAGATLRSSETMFDACPESESSRVSKSPREICWDMYVPTPKIATEVRMMVRTTMRTWRE
ncbi:Uncharacterised protein [Mycobacteroides abscessus subsp. abscessus]|nr:Uncharacterised protein [Mycobacteroides abscessus subsp. abscessus]